MIQDVINYSSNIMLLVFGITLLLSFIASFTIAPKYEKLFSKKPMGIVNTLFPCIFGRFFIRPGYYMASIIERKTRAGVALHSKYFGDYAFKAQAKPWEIIYSWIYYCAVVALTASALISMICYYGSSLLGISVT